MDINRGANWWHAYVSQQARELVTVAAKLEPITIDVGAALILATRL
jgi:hypothetical protein